MKCTWSWISLFLCDFGKNGADSRPTLYHSQYMYVVIYFFLVNILLVKYSLSLNGYCSYWLCISACALAAPLSAQAPDLQGTLSLLYSQAQQGLTPLGSDPHTHLAPYLHSFILWISQDLPPFYPSSPPFFSALCTMHYFRRGWGDEQDEYFLLNPCVSQGFHCASFLPKYLCMSLNGLAS